MKNVLEGWIRPKVTSRDDMRRAALWLPAMVFLALIWGCQGEKPPIKVGFAGGLTGRYSDLGTNGRNGVILAVEEVNQAGGINGRPVELISKDDQQDPETAIKVDRELIDKGVVAIIGHMTSAMSIAAVPLIDKSKVVMISPTTSTNQLTGKDDWFLRVYAPSRAGPLSLAEYARSRVGLSRVAAVYDLSNRVYTEDYVATFRSRFEELGGSMTATETYIAGADVRLDNLAERLAQAHPEGVLIAANAMDAAMLCQQLRKAGADLPIFASGWAMTQDFLHQGGRAVEGVAFEEAYDRDSRQETYVTFKERFTNRFGAEPSFAAMFGYEAARVLFAALSKDPDVRALKETILKQKRFQGLQGDFEIDEYGDARRRHLLITVSEGRFKIME
jgi:branched-chain amino acid transport system substrate-binding protein